MSVINLRPTRVRVTSIQGSDIPITVGVKDRDTGEPIDVTGWDFSLPVKNKRGAVLQTLTIGDGITVVSASGGQLSLLIDGNGLVFTGTCEVTLTGVLWATNLADETVPYVLFELVISGDTPSGNCCTAGECLDGEVTVYVGAGTAIEVNINGCFSVMADALQYALNLLPSYDTIEAAQADGLAAGDWFVLSDSNGYGLPKIPVKI